MAYRQPAFYSQHVFRDAVSVVESAPLNPTDPTFDDRLGEVFVASRLMSVGVTTLLATAATTAELEGLDTLIVTGHNVNGNRIFVVQMPGANTRLLLDPVPEPARVRLGPLTFSAPIDSGQTGIQVNFDQQSGADKVPQVSEIWVTRKQTIEATDPALGFNHSLVLSDRAFVNDEGVSARHLYGKARKLYTLTWPEIAGADFDTLNTLRTNSQDWAFPFWFLPWDTAYDLAHVELNRDADWEQMLEAPLQSGIGARVTLPMIEKTG